MNNLKVIKNKAINTKAMSKEEINFYKLFSSIYQ